MAVDVLTSCPFCGSTTELLTEVERQSASRLTTVELIEQLRGRRITCPNPRCERTFVVRHGDVRIHRP